ncbi:MAG TPA: L-aspartate oxidase [Brevundimonas sp.]|uniref:L-aspartate oxidase n=1 Tax=Brevundimonas sp. TaxID=1871086 RepID=UPI002DEDDCBA|nr:L-aspartate oxidase [Brevundimonas sp.]
MNRVIHDGPLIIGAGLAGLSAALETAPRPTLLISPGPLLDACASAWAQGGVAAAVGPGDAPALHALDTVAAGVGLVDATVAGHLTGDGPATVDWLARLGAPFDRDGDRFAVSLEAAHSRARVARVGGDGAGRAILSALAAAARRVSHLTIWEDARLIALVRDDAGVTGAVVMRGPEPVVVTASCVVLATGGAGGLFAETTAPAALRGEAVAMAWAVGADILDPEFVQFHPTAIDVGRDPMPLATEALRGDGARLIDGRGKPLLGEAPDADLQPRDVVARAVHRARARGDGAYLDARRAIGAHFPQAFPAVFAACREAGLDPREVPIPVAPAAHYHMGGIAADAEGRTTVDGLFAVGECAATGVHGANRLASNSLLEAAAFGRRTGRAAAGEAGLRTRQSVIPNLPPELSSARLADLRRAMSAGMGVVRNGGGLEATLRTIEDLQRVEGAALPLVTARLMVEAALARRESRGAHFREDFPATLEAAAHTRIAGRSGATTKAAA